MVGESGFGVVLIWSEWLVKVVLIWMVWLVDGGFDLDGVGKSGQDSAGAWPGAAAPIGCATSMLLV